MEVKHFYSHSITQIKMPSVKGILPSVKDAKSLLSCPTISFFHDRVILVAFFSTDYICGDWDISILGTYQRRDLGSEDHKLPFLINIYIITVNQLQRIICRSSKYTFITQKHSCMVYLNKILVFIPDTDPLPKCFSGNSTCIGAASLTLRTRGNCGRVEFEKSGQLSMHVKLGWIEEVEDCSEELAFANKKAFRPLVNK